MTERSQAGHGPGALPVIVTALGGFLIVLVFLGVQMWIGKDPVLKPGSRRRLHARSSSGA